MKKRKIAKKILKTVKNTVMSSSSERASHADTIIRNHVVWSMGAGFIPVLIADIFAVSALQLDMIRQMCKVYDIDFQETQGKAIVTSLTSTTLARLGAGSLVKMIPGIGSMLGGLTVSIFAGASTYALGEVFKQHFESGGTILDFDPDRLRKYYKEKFEKGKRIAKEMKDEMETNEEMAKSDFQPTTQPTAKETKEEVEVDDAGVDIIAKLKELGELKEKGIISDEEFDQMKKKLIDDF
ncbi:MAG: DUF697 domain-containing protein [Bacteroidota bacterium]